MTALLLEAPEAPTTSPTTTGTETPGRVMELLCVPYDVVTTWVDLPGYPGGERFARGAFAALVAGGPRAWGRVRLTDSHTEGTRPVGVGIGFVETTYGLVGRFRIYDTPEGRSGWENVREGTYGGASVGSNADPKVMSAGRVPSPRGDVREVRRARLDHVSLVDVPAYVGAGVMALHETGADGATTTIELEPTDPADYPVPVVHAMGPGPTAARPSGGKPLPSDAELTAWARAARRTPMRPALSLTLGDVLVGDTPAYREARRLRLYEQARAKYSPVYYDLELVVGWMEARDTGKPRELVHALAELAGVPHLDYCDYCPTQSSATGRCKYPRLYP